MILLKLKEKVLSASKEYIYIIEIRSIFSKISVWQDRKLCLAAVYTRVKSVKDNAEPPKAVAPGRLMTNEVSPIVSVSLVLHNLLSIIKWEGQQKQSSLCSVLFKHHYQESLRKVFTISKKTMIFALKLHEKWKNCVFL
jgi:hypothetical protein